MKSLFAASALLATAWLACNAQEKPVNSARPQRNQVATQVREVDALFSTWDHDDTPGAAVIVIERGNAVLRKGYGLADLQTRKPITPDTAFLLGSVTKQFTAMAIMILRERGKLGYDDPLSKFFPEFPSYAQQITIRHLLNHVAGFPEYDDLFVASGKIDKDWPRSSKSRRSEFEPTAKDALALLARVKQLNFMPGEKFEYSNSGYVILAQVVEKVSGQRFSQFLQQNIFKPLRMKRTILYDETRPTIRNRAVSYRLKDGVYDDISYAPQNAIYGEDNIYTTIEDMYRWDQALYTEKLVKTVTLEQAFTSGKLNNGEATGYGFGWFVNPGWLMHSGSWLGYRSCILRIPLKHFTVVVLSNVAQCDPATIAHRISKIFLTNPPPEPSSKK